jgi:hypothetical protein
MMFEATTLVEHFPHIGIFLLLVLGDMGLPFPEDATLILSGFLIVQKVTKPLTTLLVVYSGLLLTFPSIGLARNTAEGWLNTKDSVESYPLIGF